MNKKAVISPRARKSAILNVLQEQVIDSQEALVFALKRMGITVTQATASRDLLEIGAHRGKDEDGVMRYLAPTQAPAPPTSQSNKLLISAVASGNLLVLRTPPGGAQLLAGSLDHARLTTLIGTIAGDDTVLAIASTAQGGARLKEEIEEFLGSPRVKSSTRKQTSTQSRIKKKK
jgi:transcriptional regulator of arginine metabolism